MSALDELRAPLSSTDALHLNNAGVAPMCARAHDAVVRTSEKMRSGTVAVPDLLKDYEAARGSFARLVGAERADVAFFQTCAVALSQCAFGIPLARGEEVVLLDQEYPSNAYPWHRAAERAGARVVVVKSDADLRIDLSRVIDAINERTRVVAVSWVQYSTGATVDLRAIADAAHARGAWLVVDAIQGLGVIPFDLAASGADVVAGGTHKWCLGPLGHGFLALAPGRAKQMQPLLHGAMTYGTPDDPVDPARAPREGDPRRFEPGAPLLLGAVGGAAAIELMLEIGIARVHEEAIALADLVARRARERGMRVIEGGGPVKSPITTIVPLHKSAKSVVDELRARRCSTAPRGGGVRVAPHAHNGPQHIERFFQLLDEIDRP